MHIFESIKQAILVPIHPAGWPIIAVFLLASLLLTLVWENFFTIGLLLTIWCVYFFRNPVRITPDDPDAVIAPADGRIISVDELSPPDELDLPDGKYTRIAIFMNVFDVHVNRAPMTGVIIDKFYFPGAFINASLDKSATENERLGLVMQTDKGPTIGVVQIAGLLARRIICDAVEGDRLVSGEQYGIIRFGSRVDVWLPKPCKPMVLIDQRSIAGETVLARFGRSSKAITNGRSR
jgi:phosphatidylserine decarboxylase